MDMTYEEFISKIAYSKDLNAFHSDFSIENLIKLLQNSLDDVDKVNNQLAILAFIILTNKDYKSFCYYLNELFKDKHLVQIFYLYAIEYSNSNTCTLLEQSEITVENNLGVFNPLEIFNQKLELLNKDKISPVTMSDEIIDITDFIFSLLRYTGTAIKKLPHKTIDGDIAYKKYWNFNLASNFFSSLKTYYEQVCFEKADLQKIDSNTYLLSNRERFLLKQISAMRLNQKISYGIQSGILKIQKISHSMTVFKGRKIPKSIDSSVEDGSITVKYIEGRPSEIIELFAPFLAYNTILCEYYNFLTDEIKSKLDTIMQIFCVLHYLASKLKDDFLLKKHTAVKFSFSYFQFKIYKFKLVELIKNLTDFSEDDIRYILCKYFENDGTKSFWERGILKVESSYYLIVNALLNGNIASFIDNWLEIIDSELYKKGFSFENYVKTKIATSCKEKKFYSNIIAQNKFTSKSGENEEIDLIWETKNILVLAELKCIKYPLTSRNIAYTNSILEKAAKQILRKESFLFRHKEEFSKINLSKNVQKCIITNFPLYTGLTLNSIPIIDFGILSTYIDNGAQVSALVGNDGIEELKRIPLYNDEEDFSNNIICEIKNPNVVKVYKNLLKDSKYTAHLGSINVISDVFTLDEGKIEKLCKTFSKKCT